MEDRDCIRDVRAGLVDRYEELYHRHFGRAYASAFRVLHDSRSAREVAHEALTQAYEHLGEFRDECAFSTWVWALAHNRAYSLLRQRSTRSRLLLLSELPERLEPSCPGPDPRSPVVQAVLERHPWYEQALVRWRLCLEWSCAEVGAWFGLKPGTVAVYLFRVLAQVREEVRAVLARCR